MRAFLGIPISDDLKHKILDIQRKFSNFDIKFVETKNLHFNLKFFREIDDKNIEKLRQIIEEISKKYEPFEIEIKELGVFPNKNYIRVVWIGVKEGYNALVSLAEDIQNSIENLGFPREEKFVPHLTLGRIRSARNKEELKMLVNEMENIEIGRMRVDTVILFKSILSLTGPKYEEVFSIKI